MTTTRRQFTGRDIEIGIDCGIEWGTPRGSVRFEKVADYIVCEIDDVMAFTHQVTCGGDNCKAVAKEINRIIRDYCGI